MTQRHRDASINDVSRENNVLGETSKIISKIACQRWGACLLFASRRWQLLPTATTTAKILR
ncbi:hypothetical protein [Dyella japonica]|uniref:Uncharacterized protein n=1 Tax=Dyella japonica TaxID=231455 RepID=A0ABV2K0K6_9GAMM